MPARTFLNRLEVRLDRVAGFVSPIAGIASGLALFGMMWLVAIDVAGRYLLGKPTQFAFELSGYGLVAIVFLGAAATQRSGDHIRVTIIADLLPAGIQRALRTTTLLVALVYFLWLTWATMLPVLQNLEFGSTSITPLHTPLWIPTLLVPLGLGIMAIQLIVDVLRELLGRPARRSSEEEWTT